MFFSRTLLGTALAFVVVAMTASPVLASVPEYVLTIKDHKFSPEEITIPPEQKVKILIKNEDATPEEFESYELNREKIIPGKGQTSVFVGPLKEGSYPFFGEFNHDTAKGHIVVKAPPPPAR